MKTYKDLTSTQRIMLTKKAKNSIDEVIRFKEYLEKLGIENTEKYEIPKLEKVIDILEDLEFTITVPLEDIDE